MNRDASFNGRLARRVLGYFLLAGLPAILLIVTATWFIDRRISAAVAAKQTRAHQELQRILEAEEKRLRRQVEIFAERPDVVEMATTLQEGLPARFENHAQDLATASGLELLSFVALTGPGTGQIISSAHLVDAVGIDAPEIARWAEAETQFGLAHDFIQGNPPEIVVALFAVRAVGRRVAILAGSPLAGHLQNLARLGEVSLTLVSPGIEPRRYEGGDDPPVRSSEQLLLPSLRGGHAVREPGHAEGGGQAYISFAAHAPALIGVRRILRTVAVALGLASALAASLAAWVLARRLSQPIRELSDAARRAGAGDLSVQVPARSRDEVGALAAAFNLMVRELKTSRDELARAERLAAWRQIARRVAHEIKNPLSPIRMSMETLRKSFARKHPDLEEIVEESTRTVLEEVRNLNRIVTEFSDFARMPAPELQPTAPVDILAHVASLYRADPRAQLHVEREAAASVEPVAMDRGQIQRAVINLVKNAFEAVEPQGGNVWLSAREEARQGLSGVAFEIVDDGPGLPPAVREDLFTPYVTTKPTGTGLGLAIVHRIASEHGGLAHAEDGDAGGARFVIWLPRRSSSAGRLER